MAAITQQSGAVIPGQRYGSFAGKEATAAAATGTSSGGGGKLLLLLRKFRRRK